MGARKGSGLEVSPLWFLALHLSLIVNSVQGVFSKLAGRQKPMSLSWILCFGMLFVTMMAFAVAWQQILKHMSLTFAFTNKPITIIWGLIWGMTIFGEKVSWNMILGSAVILIGIMVGVSGKPEAEGAQDPGEKGDRQSTLAGQGTAPGRKED